MAVSVLRCAPELLDEVLSLLDDVDSDLQRGLLLLAEALDQILDGFHRLGVNVVQQLLLELLQPRPQLGGGGSGREVSGVSANLFKRATTCSVLMF